MTSAKFLDFLTPPTPFIRISRNLSVLFVRKIGQFLNPTSPPPCGRHLSIAPYKNDFYWLQSWIGKILKKSRNKAISGLLSVISTLSNLLNEILSSKAWQSHSLALVPNRRPLHPSCHTDPATTVKPRANRSKLTRSLCVLSPSSSRSLFVYTFSRV